MQAQYVRSTNNITNINAYHKDTVQLDMLPSPILALGIPSDLVTSSQVAPHREAYLHHAWLHILVLVG